jgi:catalase
MNDSHPPERPADAKDNQLEQARSRPEDRYLTTDQGVRVGDTDNALRAGTRGPTLIEDFHFREKITHFDHERIPERVVHARGAGAYGFFEVYESLADLTAADFLSDPAARTPVFVRFSTVAGSRGSADTVRDVRGFATKFFTRAGNYDLVGNNMPVFFIQDGIKFPDFVHAVKPEPHNEIPQAQSAHDTLWDFVQAQPETLHMMMWLMSDRAIPRSYRTMQGFGVHTFRLVTAEGRGTFVKFHWRPKLGVHSLVWDEAQQIAGQDPDFNRRDLWEAIEAGHYPEWELGLQLVPEADEHAFDFDLLDATKIIPEEQVPVRPVGRMVLDRNPDNFFAETEQVAFHTGNVVPGIDVTNDPLLQARLFSYLDTQLIRLGGPNFAQIPVNRPISPTHNHHRDGYGQQQIHPARAAYEKNTLSGGCPAIAGAAHGGYQHYQEKVEGHKIRLRSPSFGDHYSQATLFWNSMADWERAHIVDGFRFELGKCDTRRIKERVVAHLANVHPELARRVAAGLGLAEPELSSPPHARTSPALSQANPANQGDGGIAGRRLAVLAADGVSVSLVRTVAAALERAGASTVVIGPHEGALRGADGDELTVGEAMLTADSVLFDGVLVPGGEASAHALAGDEQVLDFLANAYRHGKAVAASGAGREVLSAAGIPTAGAEQDEVVDQRGVVCWAESDQARPDGFITALIAALAAHRHWDRPPRQLAR